MNEREKKQQHWNSHTHTHSTLFIFSLCGIFYEFLTPQLCFMIARYINCLYMYVFNVILCFIHFYLFPSLNTNNSYLLFNTVDIKYPVNEKLIQNSRSVGQSVSQSKGVWRTNGEEGYKGMCIKCNCICDVGCIEIVLRNDSCCQVVRCKKDKYIVIAIIELYDFFVQLFFICFVVFVLFLILLLLHILCAFHLNSVTACLFSR